MNLPPFVKKLSTGKDAIAVRTTPDCDPAALAEMLQLPSSSGLLILSGGASHMDKETFYRLAEVFAAVGTVLVEANATVIDGGTEAGAAALMGKALGQAKRTAPYIGVLPAYAEVEPGGRIRGEGILEPHHSHFVLVESSAWGEEVKIMYGLAACLADQCPSLALLVNGGNVSLQEVEWNVRQGREIIVLAGSGRLADEIATAVRHPERSAREQIRAIAHEGQLTLFDLRDPIAALVKLLKQRLMPETSAV
jgi:hypothetical protein